MVVERNKHDRLRQIEQYRFSVAIAWLFVAGLLALDYAPLDLKWDANGALSALGTHLSVGSAIDALVVDIIAAAKPGDRILVMSNGDFGGIHGRLLDALAAAG